mgnify:CR=1 FL=1
MVHFEVEQVVQLEVVVVKVVQFEVVAEVEQEAQLEVVVVEAERVTLFVVEVQMYSKLIGVEYAE